MSTSSSDPILLEVKKNVAIITLNQPKKLNSLSGALYYDLAQLLRKVAAMPEVTITILTGTGRYFSAGADVSSATDGNPVDEDQRKYFLRRFAANNLEVTRSFFAHPKILIGALNGPAVGLSAALLGACDFIYATPHTFLLTPFTSLGLVTEGGSSSAFVRRLGPSLASEALLLSKRVSAEDLLAVRFINKIFPAEGFLGAVLAEVEDSMGAHLNHGSMLGVKKLMRECWEGEVDAAGTREAFAGLERFVEGWPQREFERIARGEKRHKL